MADEGSNLIVALDFPGAADAMALAQQLDPATVRLKVGKQLFTAAGPDLVRSLQDLGFEIFLDLKFHDIPNTCLLYTSPSPRDGLLSRMPSSA